MFDIFHYCSHPFSHSLFLEKNMEKIRYFPVITADYHANHSFNDYTDKKQTAPK